MFWLRFRNLRTSLEVQWLRVHTVNVGGAGLILGRGTKILYAVQHGQRIKKKKRDLGISV